MLERNTKKSVLVKQDNSLNDLSGTTKKNLSLLYRIYYYMEHSKSMKFFIEFIKYACICTTSHNPLHQTKNMFNSYYKSHCFKDPEYKNKGKEGEFPQEFTILYGEGGGKGSTRGVLRVCGSTGKTLQWFSLRREKKKLDRKGST